MIGWFRSYHGAPSHRKWGLIAKRAGVPRSLVVALAWDLLDRASQSTDRGSVAGYDVDSFAFDMDCEPADVTRILEAMRGADFLDDDRLSGWDRRQVKREDDGAAERQREKRAREKAKREEAARKAAAQGELLEVTADHTPSHTVTTEQKRAEEKREEAGKPASAQAREPAASPPLAEDLEFQHAATAALGAGRVKGSFAPMLAIDADRERIVEVLRAASAGRAKPIGSWELAATVATEGLAAGRSPSGQGARASPAITPQVFVEVDTPEWRAWMAHREAAGKHGCPTTENPARRSCRGWHFPTRWPPGAEPATRSASALEAAE